MGVKNGLRGSLEKKRYTKTQMRLSSFPAWESPEFPTPSTLPDVAVEVLDPPTGMEAEEFGIEPQELQTLAPGPVYEPERPDAGRLREKALHVFRELAAGLRPFDPWTDDETPSTWRTWFLSRGRPNRLLADLRLAYLPNSRPVCSLLEELTPDERGVLGFRIEEEPPERISELLFVPIYQKGRLTGVDGRLVDGRIFFSRRPLAEPVTVQFGEILSQVDRKPPVLITDEFLWALEELAMGRPAVHLDDSGGLPEWWPQDFVEHQVQVAIDQSVDSPRMRYLLKRLDAWGVRAEAISGETRWNRLMQERIASEAATLSHGEQPHLVDKIRGFWNETVRRWKRPSRGNP